MPDPAELRWIVTQLHQLSGYLLAVGPTGSQPNEPANWRIAVRMAREQLEADIMSQTQQQTEPLEPSPLSQ